MKVSEMSEAIAIIVKYDPGCYVEAQHDQLWCGATDKLKDADPADLKRLDELGWFEDDDCDYWSHYT